MYKLSCPIELLNNRRRHRRYRTSGQLVIIGERKTRKGSSFDAVGGTKARIVVTVAATELPREAGENHIRVFERLH